MIKQKDVETVFALIVIMTLSILGFHGNREYINKYVFQGDLLTYEFFLFYLFNMVKFIFIFELINTVFRIVFEHVQSSSRTEA